MNTLLITLLFTAVAAMTANLQAQDSASAENGNLVHTVYFWFNDEASDEDRQNFYQELKNLQEIPQIIHGWIGVPAGTEERGVIDSSYDYSITFVFEDEEAEAEYQVHPVHLDFVENNSHLWENVVVYDAKTPDVE